MNTMEDDFEFTGRLQPSDAYGANTSDSIYSRAFEDVSPDHTMPSESGSAASSTGHGDEDLGSSVREEIEFNQEENISWSDSAFGEKSSFCDVYTSEINDGFRYRPVRVSYMYATHYTISGENLQREPLATFGKWGMSSSTAGKKGRKMAGKFCWTRRCCLPLLLLLLLLFVIVSCYYIKDGDAARKMYSDVTSADVVVMAKTRWNNMVSLLYAKIGGNKATTKEGESPTTSKDVNKGTTKNEGSPTTAKADAKKASSKPGAPKA